MCCNYWQPCGQKVKRTLCVSLSELSHNRKASCDMSFHCPKAKDTQDIYYTIRDLSTGVYIHYSRFFKHLYLFFH